VTTSLTPKDGVYLVPLKVALRRAEGIDDGDAVRVRLQVGRPNVGGPSEGAGVLTQLQADALVTADDKLAAAARAFVKTASPADILRP
jgi:hypothetical protein